MKPDFEGGGRRLARDEVMRIDDGYGVWVAAVDGTLWITQDGDPRDHVLAPGQSKRFVEHGALLIQAIGADACPMLIDGTPARPSAVHALSRALQHVWLRVTSHQERPWPTRSNAIRLI